MRGKPVMSTGPGIEYRERHTVDPESVMPERFGKMLEIPEDLVPIPDQPRPSALRADHPLARFATVYEYTQLDGSGGVKRPLDNISFFDIAAGVVIEIHSMDKSPDSYGAYPESARTGLHLEVEYDELAIRKENERRLTKALECAGFYARVIDAHQERIEREKIKKQLEEAKQGLDANAAKERALMADLQSHLNEEKKGHE